MMVVFLTCSVKKKYERQKVGSQVNDFFYAKTENNRT
jgi:hypothetical protein